MGAALDACDRAVRTHGGFDHARDHHAERRVREAAPPRIAPVTREMMMSCIAERAPEPPKTC